MAKKADRSRPTLKTNARRSTARKRAAASTPPLHPGPEYWRYLEAITDLLDSEEVYSNRALAKPWGCPSAISCGFTVSGRTSCSGRQTASRRGTVRWSVRFSESAPSSLLPGAPDTRDC
jgi:hypothetical protein